MPRYHGEEFQSVEDGKNWWKNTSVEQLSQSMGISLPKRYTWASLATEIITPGSSVYDVGCGTGTAYHTMPDRDNLSKYYGNDLNETYINEARKIYGENENRKFVVEDFYDHFNSGEKYDFVILTSIFGFFPEEESYNLIPRFWDMCNVGMGITTLNKDLYRGGRTNSLTTHDPREFEAALRALPGVGRVEMLIDIPAERKTIRRGMAAHVWRA
jgi:2-polyprenyl-3-methyl-5-hydroxy-6-metoxy-1,4-benzoquinol methylase